MINHMTLQGRLTRDLEMKTTQTGIKYTTFTLAWSEKYKETEQKCFMRCKAWRGTAEFMEKYINTKGTQLIVEGRVTTDDWTDESGQKKTITELNVDKVHFCGSKSSGDAAAQTPDEPSPMPADDGDLPF